MATTTLAQFLKDHGISSVSERAWKNPNMDAESWAATHYRVILRKTFGGKAQMTTYFSMGSAHTERPTTDDVMDCLASDAAGIENARDFDDWCSEYGYDTDSRKAERIYKACRRSAAKFRKFLGDDAYSTLLWDTERQ